MTDITPYIREQLEVLASIARHGMRDAHAGKHVMIQVDHWQHMQDELKFLVAMLHKHPPYQPVISKPYGP